MFGATIVMQPGDVFEIEKGYQLAKVSCSTLGVQAIFSYDSTGPAKIIGSDSFFSVTKDTSGKINVYKIGEYKFGIQNSTISAKSVSIKCI